MFEVGVILKTDSSHLSGRNLVGETYQRAILEHAKVSIVRVKMAYATLSVDGKVRYAEHLSNSLDVYGQGLLRDYPTVCPCNALASTTSCEGNVSKPCIHHIQTMAMKAADPGFCKLSRLCKCCKRGTRTPSQELAEMQMQWDENLREPTTFAVGTMAR